MRHFTVTGAGVKGRAWVKDTGAGLVLCWQNEVRGRWDTPTTRPLTFRERIAWRVAQRIPRP